MRYEEGLSRLFLLFTVLMNGATSAPVEKKVGVVPICDSGNVNCTFPFNQKNFADERLAKAANLLNDLIQTLQTEIETSQNLQSKIMEKLELLRGLYEVVELKAYEREKQKMLNEGGTVGEWLRTGEDVTKPEPKKKEDINDEKLMMNSKELDKLFSEFSAGWDKSNSKE